MADRFPRPYVDSVPREGTEPMMVTVDFDNLGIGARKSGTPDGDGMNRMRSLEHVGKSASNDGSKRRWGGK